MNLINQWGRSLDDLDILKMRCSAMCKAGVNSYAVESADGVPITGFSNGKPLECFVAPGWKSSVEAIEIKGVV